MIQSIDFVNLAREIDFLKGFDFAGLKKIKQYSENTTNDVKTLNNYSDVMKEHRKNKLKKW